MQIIKLYSLLRGVVVVKYLACVMLIFLLPPSMFASDTGGTFEMKISSVANIIDFNKIEGLEITPKEVNSNSNKMIAISIATFCVHSTGNNHAFKLIATPDPGNEGLYQDGNNFLLRKKVNDSVSLESTDISTKLALTKGQHGKNLEKDGTDFDGHYSLGLDSNCSTFNDNTLKIRIPKGNIKEAGVYQLQFNLQIEPLDGE